MKQQAMLLADFYKISHRKLYPTGTELIYSTWTPRASLLEGVNKVISFGQQMFLKKYLINYFNVNFFNREKSEIIQEYSRFLKFTLGDTNPETQHIEDLHDLGYLPLSIKSLPEGMLVPLRVPMMTIENTNPKFFWLTNYIETLLSAELWGMMTSATIAYEYKKILTKATKETGGDLNFIQFQAHDFSMRGMRGVESAIASGMGHLLSFTGTDTMPAILALEEFYNANIETELVGTSIPASEHSQQCSYGDDMAYFENVITKVHPSGPVSIVSDGYDFWDVVGRVLPALKDKIMTRGNGPLDKVVIRPDCYSADTQILTDSGFKLFSELKSNDLVAQMNENGIQEFVKPLKYVEQEYSGPMYSFKDDNGKLDLLVTPNHRMVFFNKNNEFQIEEAEKVKVGSWKKDIIRTVASMDKNKKLTPIERLKIAFQADGSYQTGVNKIRFSFSKFRKINRLEEILKSDNIEYKIYKLSDGKYEFNVNVPADAFRKDFEWIDTSNLCSNWSKEFIEELSYWDATRRSINRFKFDTTVKSVIDKVELISLAAGYGVLISETEDNRKECFSNVFTAHIMKNNLIGGQAQSKDVIEYTGKVYCVQVPSGMIIVKRNRGTAVCGNSGDPVKIICGERKILSYGSTKQDLLVSKGLVECLWDIFGGTVNELGFRVLDSHIGCIYGDSITRQRAEEISKQLAAKGFASTNVVYGIGSFTYQYNTRDTFGFAVKSTLTKREGKEIPIFKDPKTDSGTKKSQKGAVMVWVEEDTEQMLFSDEHTLDEVDNEYNLLREIFRDGKLLVDEDLATIRGRLNSYENN